MNKQDIDKAFVSVYDKFLYQFNQNNTLSPAQLKEMMKHQRIAELRDNPKTPQNNQDIWEEF